MSCVIPTQVKGRHRNCWRRTVFIGYCKLCGTKRYMDFDENGKCLKCDGLLDPVKTVWICNTENHSERPNLDSEVRVK